MIISFDIDNLLIPYSDEFEVAEINWFYQLAGAEKIRIGAKELFAELRNRNHDIWIYTTSFRSLFHLKKTFMAHGLYPDKFINERVNRKLLNNKNCKASKNPKLFGIDLHIDDSEGVGIEGERYGFQTIIIDSSDESWAEKILEYLEKRA